MSIKQDLDLLFGAKEVTAPTDERVECRKCQHFFKRSRGKCGAGKIYNHSVSSKKTAERYVSIHCDKYRAIGAKQEELDDDLSDVFATSSPKEQQKELEFVPFWE